MKKKVCPFRAASAGCKPKRKFTAMKLTRLILDILSIPFALIGAIIGVLTLIIYRAFRVAYLTGIHVFHGLLMWAENRLK